MKTIARWVLVVPAAMLGYYIALFLGTFAFDGIDAICPDQYQISGHCTAGPGPVVKDGIMVSTTSLAAVLVVAFATFVAPQYKATVAWLAYSVGASIVTFLAYPTGFHFPYFGALICGFLTALYIHRRETRRTAA